MPPSMAPLTGGNDLLIVFSTAGARILRQGDCIFLARLSNVWQDDCQFLTSGREGGLPRPPRIYVGVRAGSTAIESRQRAINARERSPSPLRSGGEGRGEEAPYVPPFVFPRAQDAGRITIFPNTFRARKRANPAAVSASGRTESMTGLIFPCAAHSRVVCKSRRFRP